MKKIIGILIVMLTMFCGVSLAQAQTNTKIVIDGQEANLDYPIIQKAGYTYLPLRFFSAKLGTTVDYQSQTRMITVYCPNKEIKINADSGFVYIDGNKQLDKITIKVLNGSAYVPLRFLAQTMGVEIQWDGTKNEIDIYKNTAAPTVPETPTVVKDPHILWEKDLTKPISAAPLATNDGKIYVPNGHLITALDENGQELWSLPLGKYDKNGGSEQLMGTPVKNGNSLYVATNDYQSGTSVYNRTLYSISTSGTSQWQMNNQSNYQGTTNTEPVNVAYSSKNNHIYFRDKEGIIAYFPVPMLRWTYRSDFEMPVDPLVIPRNEQADDLVLVDRLEQGKVVLLNVDGEEEWHYPIQTGKVSQMIYDPDSHRLIIALTSSTTTGGASVLCLDLLNQSWQYQANFAEDKVLKMQAIKGELYVATGTNFYKLANNGNIEKYNETYKGIKDFYVNDTDELLALDNDGIVKKYNANNVAWQLTVPDASAIEMLPSGKALISAGGKLIEIDPNK